MKPIVPILACLFTVIAPLASAQGICPQQVAATFIEGAPRDRFNFTNQSASEWQIKSITVDLAPSKGRLIFDTIDGGNGVEVFQPYRTEAGTAVLAQDPKAEDGGKVIELNFSQFAQQATFSFTIDVDDTLKNSDLRQIRVTGGELEGAELTIAMFGPTGSTSLKGQFDANSAALIKAPSCQA